MFVRLDSSTTLSSLHSHTTTQVDQSSSSLFEHERIHERATFRRNEEQSGRSVSSNNRVTRARARTTTLTNVFLLFKRGSTEVTDANFKVFRSLSNVPNSCKNVLVTCGVSVISGFQRLAGGFNS